MFQTSAGPKLHTQPIQQYLGSLPLCKLDELALVMELEAPLDPNGGTQAHTSIEEVALGSIFERLLLQLLFKFFPFLGPDVSLVSRWYLCQCC